ncbi:MAG: DNA translocase FtsK 4TM domain-containing protein [Deltaproteobacteria bacterium]|jgi:S-DNA-T family DNA segregation ATPase FtsK/SpoIIIE|nr:DNA translocase FtsK 4TM domain-containing protein [Deltaproteobacteria bacterium]
MKYDKQNSYPAPRENAAKGGGKSGADGGPRPRPAEAGPDRVLTFEGRIAPELLGLLCVLCAALLFISLLSYSPADPSLNHVVRGDGPVANWAGRFGSYLSAFLSDFFGFAAFVPFLFFAVLGTRLCMRAAAWPCWRWAGFALLLVCLAVAASFWNAGLGQIRGGGLLGLVLRDSSLRCFNPIGSGFVWSFVFLLVLQMLFGFSWRQLAIKAWQEARRSLADEGETIAGPEAPPYREDFSDSCLLHAAGSQNRTAEAAPEGAEAARAAGPARAPAVAPAGMLADAPPPEGATALEILAARALERRAGFTSLDGNAPLEDPGRSVERFGQPPAASPAVRPGGASSQGGVGAWFRRLFSRSGSGAPVSVGPAKPARTAPAGPAAEAVPQAVDWRYAPPAAPVSSGSSTPPGPSGLPVLPGGPEKAPKAEKRPGQRLGDSDDYADQPPWLADLEDGRVGASRLNLRETRPEAAPAGPTSRPRQPVQIVQPAQAVGGQPVYRDAAFSQPGAAAPGKAAPTMPGAAAGQKPRRIPPKLPPLELLRPVGDKNAAVSRDELEAKGRALMTCLANFSIQAELVRISPGPVVTAVDVRPAPGVKSSRITGLSDDIALSLKSISVRVQAPIPGTDTVGIEIPNDRREIVGLRELMASPAFNAAEGGQAAPLLNMAMGKDISGRPAIADLARMPHMLVAGATGTGKSVFLNSVLLSFLYRARPDELKLLIVDPKRIEMAVYADLPHLVHPIVVETSLAKSALDWAVAEMERRYGDIARLSVRNMAAYNQKLGDYGANRPPEFADLAPMPYLVVVIDELADLMLTAGKDVETSIVRLAQLARAAGIHLIIATQRPSVDVVTGLIKANFPCRVSFQVTSKVDSRTILDGMGAEQLLGKGDMLFKPAGGQIRRLHGAFVPDEDVGAVADYWRAQLPPSYQVDFTDWENEAGAADGALGGGPGGGLDEDVSRDPMYAKIADFVMQEDSPSISKIQRYFRIGYNRAARYWDQLKKDGIVGPDNKVRM